ncbi:MAG: AAA family ATPase [Planctomycetota bacterium]|nr:AAA family ATPase [Planctomycetota bacterium]MDA1106603.1 AAA family ATPase [Planctomycetota bacterium]
MPVASDAARRLSENIQRVFLGNRDAVSRVVVCLLARGHLLIEDVPGVGKTVLAHALARSVRATFSRIQCTPDLLPSDITGALVWDRNREAFDFRRGPVFANIVLADEVNRTTPRTQSALLEAMGEGTVSVDGTVHMLPRPFMVVATQNPYEFEGTYCLPENQLDRFLMRLSLGYPSPDDERRVIERQPARVALPALEAVVSTEEILQLQDRVDEVRIEASLVDYIVAIAAATREHDELQVGLSPRGALALAQAARATAFLEGRDYVVPDDIVNNAIAVCAHRIVPRASVEGSEFESGRRVMMGIIEFVPGPV